MSVVIGVSNIVRAFDASCVGSKVVDHQGFIDAIAPAIASFPFASQEIPGQGFVPVPQALSFVSPGVGPRSANAADYVLWAWRGRVDAFLKRKLAPPAENCAVIVYTVDAYTKDPEVDAAEVEKLRAEGATHVLVAVLAGAGPSPPIPPYRLVANLAGGNRAALVWTADEIRAKAKDAIDYDNVWCTVADDPIAANPKRKNQAPTCGSCGLVVTECGCAKQPDTCDLCHGTLAPEQVLLGVCATCLTGPQSNPNLRVRSGVKQQAIEALRAAGFQAEESDARGGVSHLRGPMAGIETNASGTQAHRVLVEAGVTTCSARNHGHAPTHEGGGRATFFNSGRRGR